MTHNEILKKFMIEYDKASVTSSYPSLTKTEIAELLNKAYLAVIAQKFTGNNARQVAFEGDTKAISDLQPLITTHSIETSSNIDGVYPKNAYVFNLKELDTFLYFIYMHADWNDGLEPVLLVTHAIAEKFFETPHNKPWLKNPICYIEDNKVIVLTDCALDSEAYIDNGVFTYLKQPTLFTKEFNGAFELNDQIAEEVVSTAIIFALENVESPRLNTKTGIKNLEA